MNMFASHSRQRANVSGRQPGWPAANVATASPVIPYDYAAKFRITGRPGNLVQDVINISTDGVFVVVGIGYGFEEERESPMFMPDAILNLPQQVIPGDIALKDLPLAAMIEGFRVNPKYSQWIFQDPKPVSTSDTFPADRIFGSLLQRVKPQVEISFLFSLVDSGTGREFQDQAAHNLASLGKSNGERPFRLLAQPFHFAPRSTLRLQITERTEGIRGTLFIVLYGYRLLGPSSCPEPAMRQLRGMPLCPVETIGSPDAPIIPFDYVSSLQLTGEKGNLIEDEIPVSAEGGFVATSIGYGVAPENADVKLLQNIANNSLSALAIAAATTATLDLGQLMLKFFPQDALLDGIRIRPGWLRVALQNNGKLANNLPFDLLDNIFERLNRAEDISFRYAFFDSGTGRELQNQKLNNIAGLGIANGDRPFKKLARPMIFLPRSTIRVEVEEVFGRGTLHIVFQGYKLCENVRGRP